MKSPYIVALALLCSATVAIPGPLDQRAACNADSCLRGLRNQASAAVDCQSFLQTTIYPCSMSTVTSYSYTTVTAKATTVTYGQSTQTSSPAPAKRNNDGANFKAREAEAAAISSSPSCPSTSTATALPAYATACSGAAKYTSACACIGATSAGTTTISTTTTVLPATTTLTPTVTVCTDFIVQATSGPNAGQYFGVPRRSVVMTADVQQAARFTRNARRQIVQVSSGNVWFADSEGASSIRLEGADSGGDGFDEPLECNVGKFQGSYNGSLTCRLQRSRQPEFFEICVDYPDAVFVDGAIGGFDECEEMLVRAVPACPWES